jgi:hypothetical protein
MWLKNLFMLMVSTSSRRRLTGHPPVERFSHEALEDRLVSSHSIRYFDARPAPAQKRRTRTAVSRRHMLRPRLELLEDRLAPAVFTPTTLSDGVTPDGTVNTLRDAIIAANRDNGADTDTIRLSAGTYKLTMINIADNHDVESSQGDLNILNTKHALVIQGTTDANGKPTTIIDQTVADRVFQILDLDNGPAPTVTFKDLIIQGGNARDDGSPGGVAGKSVAQGGGILVDGGKVTLSNVVVQSNQATSGATFFAQGGGIFVGFGTLTLNNSVIQNNGAVGGVSEKFADGGDADGGGVALVGDVDLSMTNSSVLNNVAQGGAGINGLEGGAKGGDAHGGGIYSEAANNSITGSTLANNSAIGGRGTQGNPDGNGSGGGAELFGNNVFVNSTIANNSTIGLDAAGGGVFFAKTATGQLTHVTVAGNQAKLSGTIGSAEGGGLDNENGAVKDVTLTNTLVAGNTVKTSAGLPESPDVRGQLVSGGHNLIGIADGVNDPGFKAPGDLAGSLVKPLNPKLDLLQNNGGPTLTMLPQSGSPALGAGDTSKAPGTDQRGQPRPKSGPTDIGSAQVSNASPSPSPSPSPAPTPSPSPSPSQPSPPPPSLFQAILGLYIAEVQKDLGFGDPAGVQSAIDFYAQYTVIFGINIAPLIKQLADTNVHNAQGGGS